MYFKKLLESRTNVIHNKWMFKCTFATFMLSSVVSSEIYANTFEKKNNDARKEVFFASEQNKNKKITGTVLDKNKESLIGVSVVVKGTTNGTVTDFDGNFSLDVSASDILQFSYIGYQSISLPVGKTEKFNITMQEDTQQLDEIVVTGYGGTQLRSKLTASIATLDTKVLSVGARSNPASALAGTISGLRVDQTSGKPGSSPKIVLRGGTAIDGSGSPLVIIDGIVRSGLNDINPEDIESMQVLKDAAATSIYGARASNGVILVSTKRGSEGKTSITFKAKAGLSFLPMANEFLDAKDYIYYQRKAHDRAGNQSLLDGPQAFGTGNVLSADGNKSTHGVWSTMFLTDDNKHKLADGWKTMTDPVTGKEIIYNDYNYADVAFNNPAVTQDYNVNITGGNKQGGYYAGIGYYDEKGLPINTFYRRLNFTFNGDYKIKDWLTSNSSFSFSNAIWRDPTTSGEANYFGRMLSAPPTMRGYNEEGELLLGLNNGDGNPNYNDSKFIRKNNSNKFVFGQSLNFDLTKSIYLKISGTWYYDQSFNESFNKDYLNSPGQMNVERKSSAEYSRTLRQTYNAVAGWKKTFAKHDFDFLVGGEYYDLTSVGLSASGRETPTDDFSDLGLTSNGEGKRGTDTSHSTQRILSMLGRLNYDYDGKYLAAFSFRQDGYSRLLGDNRWGFFPGVSVGWIIGKENFMEPTRDVISFLKLRASYGVNGSVDNIGVYELQGSYKPTDKYNGNIGFNLSELPNPNLRWEKSNTFEVGLDASFFENKITTSFAYYNRLTKDKIANIVLPNSSGWATMRTNNGELRNAGLEIETKVRVFENADWRWMLSGNISYNKNTVVKLPDNGLDNNRQGGMQIYDPKSGELIWVGGTQEGHSPDELYAYEVESIYRTNTDLAQDADRVDKLGGGGKFIYGQDSYDNLTDKSKGQQIEKGDIRWVDVDKNDTIDYRDKTYQGHKIPRWTGGFASDLTYKGFNLYARFDFALGHTMYNNVKGWYLGNMQGTFNTTVDVKDTWSEENPNAKYPSYYYADQNYKSNYYRGTSMLYEKASYLCLRDVTLSYTIPQTLLRRIGIEAMNLSVTGSNLAYFTTSTLYSPEYGAGDMGGYPLPKTVVFGASLTF